VIKKSTSKAHNTKHCTKLRTQQPAIIIPNSETDRQAHHHTSVAYTLARPALSSHKYSVTSVDVSKSELPTASSRMCDRSASVMRVDHFIQIYLPVFFTVPLYFLPDAVFVPANFLTGALLVAVAAPITASS